VAEGEAASKGAERRILGEAGLNNGKSSLPNGPRQSPACPECGSRRAWKDGLRHPRGRGRPIQRFLCRSCGYRFSEPNVELDISSQVLKRSQSHYNLAHNVVAGLDPPLKEPVDDLPLLGREDVAPHKSTAVEQSLNTLRPTFKRRICADEKKSAKNSATVGQTVKRVRSMAAAEPKTHRTAAGDIDAGNVKGFLFNFAWWLKKQGYADSTIRTYSRYLSMLKNHGADLHDPESVKEVIARLRWAEATKSIAINSYTKILESWGESWTPPKVRVTRKIPFIPQEKEIDQLISGARKKMACFLQLLKETGMRSGEAWRLKWIYIDFERRTITLNEPEKSGKPRVFKVRSTLISMLKNLQQTEERVFTGKLHIFRRTYRNYRKRLAQKLQNPRLRRITFHTIRHWKATMEYSRTKDILHVQQLLGHRDIKTTMIYTHLVQFEGDEFHSATAETVAEAEKLIAAGFEYVCTYNDVMIFRKRK